MNTSSVKIIFYLLLLLRAAADVGDDHHHMIDHHDRFTDVPAAYSVMLCLPHHVHISLQTQLALSLMAFEEQQ